MRTTLAPPIDSQRRSFLDIFLSFACLLLVLLTGCKMVTRLRSSTFILAAATIAFLLCPFGSKMAAGSRTDDVLNVVWLAPAATVDDGVRAVFNASTSVGGLALAIDRVRSERLLGGMRINVTWLDSACYAKTSLGVVTSVVRDLTNLPDVIIGPPCTTAMQPVADLGSYFNIPVFGWMSSDHRLDNKSRASTLVRVMAPLSDLGNLLIYICAKLGWNRVAMISTQGPITTAVSDFFKELLREDSDFYLVRHFSNVTRVALDYSINRMLRLISEEARIIFLVMPESEVRRYLLHAYDLGMQGGDYQFLYVQPYISDDDEVDYMRSRDIWRGDDGRDEDAREIYRSLLIITYSYIVRWSFDYEEAENVTNRMFADYRNDMPEFREPDRYSRFLHDAFYLYALAFNYTVANNMTPAGDTIFQATTVLRFNGLSGDVHLNRQGDRLPAFLMWDMDLKGRFQIVTTIKYDALPDGSTFINYTERADIYWGNGETRDGGYIPPDIPVCGFNNEKCPRDNSMETILPSVLSTAVVAGIVVFVLVYRWWKREQGIHRKSWRVEWSDLVFTDQPGGTRTHVTENGSNHSSSTMDSAEKAEHEKMSCSANLSVNASSLNTSSGASFASSHKHFCKTAHLRGNLVSVRMIRKKAIKMDRRTLEDMQQLNTLRHGNLALFYGACVDPPHPCVLWEYCAKGSVQDIIQNNDVRLDSMFQFSLAMDITAGLAFIHTSELKVHGNLRSTNCLVDNRWTCKLSGFGLRNLLRGEQPLENVDEMARFTKLLWMAPENLRRILKGERRQLTQPADIYSLAIILKEILCKNAAYDEEMNIHSMTPKDIVTKVAQADGETYFRPMIGDLPSEHQGVMMAFVRLINGCWAEDPALRPNCRRVQRLMKKLNPFQTTGIMDNMLKMMERYSSRLEDVVAERTAQLAEEKRKTDTLLYRMLPQKVADDLKSGQHVAAELYPSVTVYFSDIVGFTQLAAESTPMQIIDLLNLLYTVFDNAIQNFEVYKVETIGDAYMVVSGLPVSNGLRHATIMADMSLTLLRTVLNFTIPHQPGKQLRVRIGLNTGPVVAGVVGNIMPRYCLFGDTVNLASRMESHGLPLKIQMSPYTYSAIEDKSSYVITERGEIEVKGKGRMKTYWLEGKVEVDEGPIEFPVKARNPSTVNLHNFNMEGFIGAGNPSTSPPDGFRGPHDASGERSSSKQGMTSGGGDGGSSDANSGGGGGRGGDGGAEVEPVLYEKEMSGPAFTRHYSSRQPALQTLDETAVLY